MPVGSAVRDRCRTLLGDQGEIQYVFPASSAGPVSVFAEFPRDTRLGPILTGHVLELGSMVFEFDEEYAAVVSAADAEIFAPETLPPDPLPDL